MTKLTVGIGEDFPVAEKQDARDCRSSRRRRHHHHGELHARWHRWLHERFGRSKDDKKDTAADA